MTQQLAPSSNGVPPQPEAQAIPDISLFNGLLHVELFDSFIGPSGMRAEIHLIYAGEMFRIKACSADEAASWLRRAQRLITWKRYPDDTLSGIYVKPGYQVPDWVQNWHTRMQSEEARP
jgi:hypothetical protein